VVKRRSVGIPIFRDERDMRTLVWGREQPTKQKSLCLDCNAFMRVPGSAHGYCSKVTSEDVAVLAALAVERDGRPWHKSVFPFYYNPSFPIAITKCLLREES